MTASSIRSAWEKLSAITCSALIESGLVVMLPSEVNADPIRVPMATTEAARISPHAATTRHGWTAADAGQRLGDRRTARVRELPVTILRTCREHVVVPLVVAPVVRTSLCSWALTIR